MSRSGPNLKNTAWNEIFALLLLGTGRCFFRADLLRTERLPPGSLSATFLAEPGRPNFMAVWSHHARVSLTDESGLLPICWPSSSSDRRGKIISLALAGDPRLLWIVLFLVSGACLLQLQTRHLQGWRAAFNIHGPGGWVGYSIGKKLLQTWMGGVGSIILLSGVYVSSLILMTGLRPIHIVREGVAGIRASMQKFTEWQRNRRLRKADWKTRLELRKRKEREQRQG